MRTSKKTRSEYIWIGILGIILVILAPITGLFFGEHGDFFFTSTFSMGTMALGVFLGGVGALEDRRSSR